MIITISRGSYSRGKKVAEKVAKELNYECISRDILLEASEHFHIPEIKLVRAIHDSPGILNRFSCPVLLESITLTTSGITSPARWTRTVSPILISFLFISSSL